MVYFFSFFLQKAAVAKVRFLTKVIKQLLLSQRERKRVGEAERHIRDTSNN